MAGESGAEWNALSNNVCNYGQFINYTIDSSIPINVAIPRWIRSDVSFAYWFNNKFRNSFC